MRVTSKIPKNITNTGLVRSMYKRRGMEMVTRSEAHQNSSEVLTATSATRNGDMGKGHSNMSDPTPVSQVEIPVEDPDKPSTDLRPKPKGIIRWFKYLPGRIRNYYKVLRPPLTPEELEKLEAEKLKNSRNKLCLKEGLKYARLISDKLAQLGEREIIGNNQDGKPRRVKKVHFTKIARDELFTKIIMRLDTDPRHLPSYVRLSDLGRKEFYADEMLPTLGHFMEFKSDEAGVFAVVYRAGLNGIPPFISAEDIWNKIPDNKPLLTFPVGYRDNSQRVDIDLDDCPHLLVGGATGQGKSNFINDILSFWLHRGLTPGQLQLVLFDLKRGMEFCFYEGLPHLYHDEEDVIQFERDKASNAAADDEHYDPAIIETGIIEDLSDVIPAMRRLRKIMDHRLGQIKNSGHKDFNAYNLAQHATQKKLPALVVVIDEWARIRLSLGLEPETMLAEMTNLARAAGIYFILGTQNPNATVISNLISINFSVRIIFKCSVGGSMAALGNQGAIGLSTQGRAILQLKGNQYELQTPRITDGLIKAMVYKATTGKDKKSSSPVDLEEILQHSLDHFDGELNQTKLFAVFRQKKVRWEWLVEALRKSEGHQYNLSGTWYEVKPARYHQGRRLERVADEDVVDY